MMSVRMNRTGKRIADIFSGVNEILATQIHERLLRPQQDSQGRSEFYVLESMFIVNPDFP
jgi:hypothetical protein